MICEDCYTLSGLEIGWLIFGTMILTTGLLILFIGINDLTKHDKKGDFRL